LSDKIDNTACGGSPHHDPKVGEMRRRTLGAVAALALAATLLTGCVKAPESEGGCSSTFNAPGIALSRSPASKAPTLQDMPVRGKAKIIKAAVWVDPSLHGHLAAGYAMDANANAGDATSSITVEHRPDGYHVIVDNAEWWHPTAHPDQSQPKYSIPVQQFHFKQADGTYSSTRTLPAVNVGNRVADMKVNDKGYTLQSALWEEKVGTDEHGKDKYALWLIPGFRVKSQPDRNNGYVLLVEYRADGYAVKAPKTISKNPARFCDDPKLKVIARL
jgi:hypothetical protein